MVDCAALTGAHLIHIVTSGIRITGFETIEARLSRRSLKGLGISIDEARRSTNYRIRFPLFKHSLEHLSSK